VFLISTFCLKNYFWEAKLNNHKTKMAKDFFIIFMCKNLLTKIYILKKTWALYLVGGQNYCCLKASTFSKIILYLRHPFYFFLALFLARRNKKSSIFLCQFYWKCMKIIRKVEKTSLLGPFNAKKIFQTQPSCTKLLIILNFELWYLFWTP